MTQVRARDLTSLAERFGALLAVRLGMAAAVTGAALLAHHDLGVGVATLGPLTIGYLVVALAFESLRRATRSLAVDVQNAMLLIDAVYVAIVVVLSGGPHSPLMFLFAAHLIAVTLLGAHGNGLRIALWDSFLFVLIYTLSLSSEISRLFGMPEPAQPAAAAVALSIGAFWVVAGCTAIFSWVNERELRRSKDELRALAEMGAELEVSRQPDEVLEVLLAKTTEAFGFGRAAVLLDDGDGPRVLASRVGGAVEFRQGDAEPATYSGAVGRAWAQREPVLVRRLDPGVDAELFSVLPGARNVVVVPLTAEGDPLGVLAVEKGGNLGLKIPARVVTLLSQFAAHAALAVRNARLLAEVERLAHVDGLTGVANRRAFETVLTREVRRARRGGGLLSLVVFDVDHFKAVNDTYGHQAGDAVLRDIAQVLTAATRDVDIVCRYGGEEFAIVLPACGPGDAMRVAERVRRAVADHTDLAGVTVSAGVASLPAHAVDGEGIIAAADEALYRSKDDGRDRVTVSHRRMAKVTPISRLG
jgi:two-component system, cell cycle response regulator